MSKYSLIVTLLLAAGAATNSGIVPEGFVEITIESREISYHPTSKSFMQCTDTIDIVVTTDNQEISGANLKIAVLGSALTITDILPGDFIETCQWEYFETRQPVSKGEDSLNLWQITALSELLPDSTRPLCYRPENNSILARIVIESIVTVVPDSAQRIAFFWQDCPDNTLSDKTGNKLFVSEKVLNLPPGAVTDSLSFPTFSGARSTCINDKNPNRPLRRVIFRNGTLTPKLAIDEPADSDSTEN